VVAHAGPYPLRADLAKTTGLPPERIRVIHAQGSGCYGHNGADDAALDAALLSISVNGRLVKLQWMRDDEFGWEPFGSAMRCRREAGYPTTARSSTGNMRCGAAPTICVPAIRTG